MAGIRIQDGAGSTLMGVDSNNNGKVNLPTTETQAGFASLVSEVDDGTVLGTRYMLPPETSQDFRLRAGLDKFLFNENFPGSAINSAIWTAPVTTMTLTVNTGFARLNAGLSVAASAVARLSSYRAFPVPASGRLYAEMHVQLAQLPQASNVCEWGLGYATGTSAPTDGAFFRLDSAGAFRAVVNANGTEQQSDPLDFAALVGAGNTRKFLVGLSDQEAVFWIDNQLVARISLAAAGYTLTASLALPLLFRTYNTGTPAAAQSMLVGMASVLSEDTLLDLPYAHQAVGWGGHASQGQTGGTMGSTANYANSANPAAAVPTNTTAALGSGLGGQFWETDTLAVTTDGIISSFQVPAGTAALPGRTLMITRVTVDSYVQTALTGGGYVAQWSLAYGHTAVSLATTEAATTKAPRRVPLGAQAVASGAVAGAVLSRVEQSLDASPIAVLPGEFVQLVKKKVGTAPSAGVIAHVISIGGYWI